MINETEVVSKVLQCHRCSAWPLNAPSQHPYVDPGSSACKYAPVSFEHHTSDMATWHRLTFWSSEHNLKEECVLLKDHKCAFICTKKQ